MTNELPWITMDYAFIYIILILISIGVCIINDYNGFVFWVWWVCLGVGVCVCGLSVDDGCDGCWALNILDWICGVCVD